ncbi:MAG: GNAT family N-acetyltransferase [Defluviitaleaceae bacterium]|nr:GNAT family N-acetyltransferase [Defluviitaleaceae bacterium]
MNYRQATKKDHDFITSLVTEFKEELGYPCGDLVANFIEIKQPMAEAILVAESDGLSVGVAGIFNASWGNYVVGPVFTREYQNPVNIQNFLQELINEKVASGQKIQIDVRSTNLCLSEALNKMNAPITYSGVAMYCELTEHQPMPLNVEIKDITITDVAMIETVNEIFSLYLKPWKGHDVEDLHESLSDGTSVSVLLKDNRVIGAIVWDFSDGSGEIEYLCIDRKYQRQGYAKMLVNHCKNLAASRLVKGEENRLYLDVDQENDAAIKFYESQAFKHQYLRNVHAFKNGCLSCIRYAIPDDATAISEINVKGWQTAYRGIFPDEFLDGMNAASRIESFKSSILENPNQNFVFADEGGHNLGFASFGKLRWEEFSVSCDCELYAIYVASSSARKGIGRALLEATIAEFKKQGKKSMLINVLEQNTSAMAFYQHLGGRLIGHKDFTLNGKSYPQLTLAFEI